MLPLLKRKMRPIFRGLSLTEIQTKCWKFYKNNVYQTNIKPCHTLQTRFFSGIVHHSSSSAKPHFLSSILVQEENLLIEMPCIVQVINGSFEITSKDKLEGCENLIGLILEEHQDKKLNSSKTNSDKVMTSLCDLLQCETIEDIYQSFSFISAKDVSPVVSLFAMILIFELESKYTPERNLHARSTLLNNLIETICNSESSKLILRALKALLEDSHRPVNSLSNYAKTLCTECIILATKGKLTVEEICQMIQDFHSLGDIAEEYIDCAWVGINKDLINEKDLVCIAKALPFVKRSQPYLYAIFENKFTSLLFQLQDTHMCEIIPSIQLEGIIKNKKLLPLFSKWMNVNSNHLNEETLSAFVNFFSVFKYTDKLIQNEISAFLNKRYIKDSLLVVTIANYLSKMRIRDSLALQGAADYFFLRPRSIKADQIIDITRCFASLNFIPEHPKGFTLVWESIIRRKLRDLSLSELLSLSVNCLQLGCSPMDIIRRKLVDSTSVKFLNKGDKNFEKSAFYKDIVNILILNTLFKMDSIYVSPIQLINTLYNTLDIPQEFLSLSIERDDKIELCLNKLKPILQEIIDSEIQEFVLLPLSAFRLFEIDLVITQSKSLSNKTKKLAILINLPEDFDITGEILLGDQILKQKVIEKFDYEVINLKYQIIDQLSTHPDKLKEYLQAELKLWLKESI